VVCQTNVEYNTLTPVWNETFIFPLSGQNVTEDGRVLINVTMYDFDVITGKPYTLIPES
jgi:Ca2+-dependent lipid-binding protein